MPCAQAINNPLRSHMKKEGGPWQEDGLVQEAGSVLKKSETPPPEVEFPLCSVT